MGISTPSQGRSARSKSGNIETHYRTCNLCEAMCGVAIETSGEEILSIKGDKNDPFSKGHICPKAVALQDLHEDPDRIRQPLLKTDEGWKEIAWPKAFDIAGEKLRKIQKRDGHDAVGLYVGNPNVHHHGNAIFLYILYAALKTRNRFAATSNDQLPHMRACLEMFGHQIMLPVPDIDHSKLLILFGSNPMASNGSVMSAPDFNKRIKKIQSKGGEFVVVDPRFTETAKIADQHHFIKPGTDAYMLLAMIHTLFDEGLVETGRLTTLLDDIAQIQLISSDFSPESVADAIGIEAESIRALARKLANTPRACLYGRIGTSVQEFGTIATWLIYVINVLTNHMDERGGLMFTKPAADVLEVSGLAGLTGTANTFQSRVNKLPEFGGDLPCSAMADEILTEGEGQIKAMIVIAGNPVISSPNGKRLDKAFEQLEFQISIDSYLNETSRHADLILPPTSQLEQSHYDLVFNLLSVRNVAKYSPPLFKPAKHARHDWEIMLELVRRVQRTSFSKRIESEAQYQVLKRLGPDGILDLLLRIGPYGTQVPGTIGVGSLVVDAAQDLLDQSHPLRLLLDAGPYGSRNRTLSKGLCVASLKNYPHGIDLGPLQSCLPDRLFTEDKRIKLAPAEFLSDITRLRRRFDSISEDELLLIGRRHVRSNNSWMHNSYRLVKGKNRCTAIINPKDASKRRISDGQLVKITSRVGTVEIEAEISDTIMPGVISIPHGWGHNRDGSGLSVAEKHAGVSINDITDDQLVDKLSGTSVLNGIPVSLSSVRKTRASSATTQKTATRRTSGKKAPAKASTTKATTASKPRVRAKAKVD